MRKFLLLGVMILSLAGYAYAVDATEATNPEAQPFLMYGKTPAGIAKLAVGARTAYKAAANDYQVYSGACWVKSVSLSGTTAADAVMIYNYDSLEPNQCPSEPYGIEFELQLAANTSNVSWNPDGAYFNQGIFIHSSAATNKVNVVYDY